MSAIGSPLGGAPGPQASSDSTPQCSLCGLPARAPVRDNEFAPLNTYCCNGCRNVWRILSESGQLGDAVDVRSLPLFQHALKTGLIGQTQAPAISDGAEIGITPTGDGGSIDDVRRCIVRIEGMWCASCAWLIAESLRRRKGILAAEVSFAGDSARITYKPARVGFDDMRATIRALGYDASEDDPAGQKGPVARKRSGEMIRVTVAFIFCAMNVMMLTPILYLGPAEGVTPFIVHLVNWLLLILSVPVFIAARPLFERAIRAALHGAAIMETLVTLGASAAFIFSTWQVFHGALTSYFDTADMLLGMVLLGKYIENNIRARQSDSIALLHGLTPKKASYLAPSGEESAVSVDRIGVNDLIRVRAGEIVAADGVVKRGTGSADESLLTGESVPVGKQAGDNVTGGSTLLDGCIDVRVARPAAQGSLRSMADLVQEALHRKTRSELIADRISRIFVPVVIVLAAFSAIWVMYQSHDAAAAVTRAVAVLVIACPCALGIAIPMAILAGVGAAAHQGMIVSDPEALGVARRLRRVIFDKTGTLTEGRFAVLACEPPAADLAGLAALEQLSEHPIARALRHYARGPSVVDSTAASEAIEDFTRMDGGGVSGVLAGERIFAGNAVLARALSARIDPSLQSAAARFASDGRTVVYYGVAGGDLRAVIALGDRLRPTAPALVERLKALSIESEIISGDAPSTVAAVAREAGIAEWSGGILPTEKARLVAERQSQQSAGTVAMVGDGVNDAPALASADLGIAMEHGADIAGRAAAVTIMSSHLDRLVDLVEIAKRTDRVIVENLAWALVYNVVCIPLALIGLITPIWAAAAMLISSLTVVMNSRRLTWVLDRRARLRAK